MVSWRSVPRQRSRLAPAAFIDPARPVTADKPPSGANWIHEIKHDGYRLQIHKHGRTVRLFTMTGVDWTERYPWIVDGAKALQAEAAIIDAECCIVADNGVTVFDALHARTKDSSAFAYAFDLLMVDGEDVRALPIEQRKDRLARLLPKLRRADACGIELSEHLTGDGPLAYTQACLLGLEGIVSKRLGSKYRSGRCTSWIKVKNPKAPGYLRHVDGGY